MDTTLFGTEDSPQRESPKFRLHMEKYKLFKKKIEDLDEVRGYLSYEQTLELSKLKKLKLIEKDEMIKWKL